MSNPTPASSQKPEASWPRSQSERYTGRFAPSPTGPLHFGSLVAAAGSYLHAKAANGRWLVRIEDIDRPREVAGAADDILRTLEALGFEWDGSVERQSQRLDRYEHALSYLQAQQRTFLCSCSRSDIARTLSNNASGEEQRYPGTCRLGPRDPTQALAVRLRVEPGIVAFDDLAQGHIEQDISATVGDFVLKRRDGLHAYHLAVVVDDAAQGVTDIVRGADLLDSTPRQLLLYAALGSPPPRYLHLPLAVDSDGRKLSKSLHSLAIDTAIASESLWQALTFLRQAPPLALRAAPVAEQWAWARQHWRTDLFQGITSALAPAGQIS